MTRQRPLMQDVYVESGRIVRGTPPTILRSAPSVGIAVYDPVHKIGYLGNIIGEVSFPKETRAKSTCEHILRMVRKDKADPSRLYAVLAGDSIHRFEYDGNITDGREYFDLEAAVQDHEAYRKELVQAMASFGIPKEKVYPFFVTNFCCEQEILLDTTDGSVEIVEFYLQTSDAHEHIFLHDGEVRRKKYWMSQ